MTALATDAYRQVKGPVIRQTYPMAASSEVFKGGLVAVNASGFAVPAADTAGLKVVGIADQGVDNTSGGNGDAEVLAVRTAALFSTTGANPVTAAGAECFVLDDDTVVAVAGATNDVSAGEVLEMVGSSACWVDVGFKAAR